MSPRSIADSAISGLANCRRLFVARWTSCPRWIVTKPIGNPNRSIIPSASYWLRYYSTWKKHRERGGERGEICHKNKLKQYKNNCKQPIMWRIAICSLGLLPLSWLNDTPGDITCFYRAMHDVLARYCYRKSSVRPSVLSVRDVDVCWVYRLD